MNSVDGNRKWKMDSQTQTRDGRGRGGGGGDPKVIMQNCGGGGVRLFSVPSNSIKIPPRPAAANERERKGGFHA